MTSRAGLSELLRTVALKEFKCKKLIDKAVILMYNNICVITIDAQQNIGSDVIRIWRNTQEAEEAPLLRV